MNEVELLGIGHGNNGVENGELSSSEGADHNATCAESVRAQLYHARLNGEGGQAGHNGTVTSSTRLVDHGQQGISRVGNDGGSNPGDHTGRQSNCHLGAIPSGLGGGFGQRPDLFGGSTLHGKLGHGMALA